jgi:hypothetical protein
VQTHPFGITFDYQNFSETSSNIANLPADSCLHNSLIGDVALIKISGGTSITLNHSYNSTAKGLIFKTGASTTGTTQILLASAYYGNGKVAALTDSSPPDDGTGDPNDNLYYSYTGEANGSHRIFLLNTTIWLAAGSSTDTTSTSVTEIETAKTEMQIFPNPLSNENLQLIVPENLIGEHVEVLDAEGRKFFEEKITSVHSQIALTHLSNGIYFVRVNEQIKKFIKLF